MTTSPARSTPARFRLRAGLLVPAAVAVTLLTACSSTTSGQGSAGSAVSPTSAPVPAPVSAVAVAPVSSPPVSAPSVSSPPISSGPASAPSGSTSSALVDSAPANSAPAPVTVTATQTQTATATATAESSPSLGSSSPDATTSDATPPGAPTSSTPSAKNILGPDGYLGVKLGESQPTAKLDAIFASTPAVTTSCKSWDTIAGARIQSALISAKLGVAGIYPRDPSNMQTPEGMTVGWTAKQVHAAYPSFSLGDTHEEDGGPEIAVPQDSDAVYKVRFDGSDKVVSFFLLLRNQDCFD